MHRYRSHTCGALRDSHIDQTVRLSGWCHRIRDHGGVLFIDLRDHYGLTQCVADPDSPAFKALQAMKHEPGHHNHVHVRFKCPGNRDCRDATVSLGRGTGC